MEHDDNHLTDRTGHDSLRVSLSRRDFTKASALTAGAFTFGIGGLGTAAAEGGGNGDPADSTSTDGRALHTEIVAVPTFVEDADGNPAPFDDPETKLHEIRAGNRLCAPDGHHVTWGEFSSIHGLVYVDCLGSETVEEPGTRVVVLVAGLIPNAVYTIWNVTFGPPGFDGTLESIEENLSGFGGIGPNDGSQSTFRSTAAGLGAIGATTPAGEQSEVGRIEACALDEYEWHVVGAYHQDDRSHGPSLGPDGTAVEQFAFVFGGSGGGQ